MFERIAIVNRGEPAMRLIHTAAELRERYGDRPRTVALHTHAERDAMFVRAADEAVRIGPGPGDPAWTTNPYLDHDELARALRASGADAAWVGWGFVAESPAFAERCEQLGITFVGPSGPVMRALGDKIGAKQLAERAGVPVAAWSGGAVADLDSAREHAERIGYPLMVKAAAGGGGRGIRRVDSADGLAVALERATAEGASAFGDPTVFLEQLVTDAHHVEVQILADGHGGVLVPGVRDCSVQRRNQKVIEESSSVVLPHERELELRRSAAELARLTEYRGAGTVEFLYQPEQDLPAFLEVNTRLQVEHTVTELTTGLDLVELQLRVAAGERLAEEPEPQVRGHAIEVRLNAEDPERGFAPASGRVELLDLPTGPGVRVDTGIAEGDPISPDYDSMIAKVLAVAPDRATALSRLRRALSQTSVLVEGGTTNRPFLLDLLRHEDVVAGRATTAWLDGLTADGGWRFTTRGDVALIAAAIDAYDAASALDRDRFYAAAARGRPQIDPELPRQIDLRYAGRQYPLTVACTGPDHYLVSCDGLRVLATVERLRRFERRLTVEDARFRVVSINQGPDELIEVDGVPHRISQDDAGLIRAPGPSVVVQITVEPGDVVESGTTVAVLESMKMETPLTAPFTGTVVEVAAGRNVQLDAGAAVVRLEPVAEADDEAAADTGSAVSFERLARPDGALVPGDPGHALDVLRRLVLGYDVPEDTVDALLGVVRTAPDDAATLRGELAVLRAYADITSLSRNRRLGDDEDAADAHSAREYLHAFLRSLDTEAEQLPASFQDKLRRALAHHDVAGLERSVELEEALYRIHLAQHDPAATTVVIGLLEGRLRAGAPDDEQDAEQLRETLDRLIVATQARQPVIGDLARRARYRAFEQPRLEQQRERVYAEVREHLRALAEDPDRPDRDGRMAALVAAPEPLLGLLEDPVTAGDGLAPMLELLTRRYYRTRELSSVRSQPIDGRQAVVADFVDPRGQGRVVAVPATADDLTDALSAAAELSRDVPPDAGAGAVADVYVTWRDAPTDLELLAAGLETDLDAAELPEPLRRVTLSVTVAPGDDLHAPERPSVEHLTFRRTE
ncbi:MAG: biotin carboxylase N-terminal domain-containing protein, partial [Nitriliruptoraceae bacterium]